MEALEFFAEHAARHGETKVCADCHFTFVNLKFFLRFITYLAEINPSIIDVIPCEEPPIGFPKAPNGIAICAKCNTRAGCNRTLYDDKKLSLKEQLFENEELHNDTFKLMEWTRHAIESQRCIWGLHRPIQKAEMKPFENWFNRMENKGFVPYDGSQVLSLLRDLVYYHHQLSYDMMQHSSEYSAAEYNLQATKTFKLKDAYKEVSGQEFIFELPCTNDNEACNLRRRADKGVNHMHEVLIDLPTKIRLHTYEEAAKLREELLELGILPASGVVGSIEERVAILRAKLEEHRQKERNVRAARERLRQRPALHKKERSAINAAYLDISSAHCSQACDAGDVNKALIAVRRGSDPNTESPRGITPLICLVLNDGRVDDYEELSKRKANFNAVNRNGMTALVLACILLEVKHVHGCLKNGASVFQLDAHGRTAFHWCALQSNEDGLQVLMSYITDAGGDAKAAIDARDGGGNTALALAAQHRNGLMCKLLCSQGADTLLQNFEGKTASMLARERGFSEIADWLDRRVGGGVVKLESSDDAAFERMMRYGAIKSRESISTFISLYARCAHMNVKHSWIVDAASCKKDLLSRQNTSRREQLKFVKQHYSFLTSQNEFKDTLHSILESILLDLKAGKSSPNVEGACGLISWTPLMCACVLNDVIMIRLFLKEGATVNMMNKHGMTAVMLASWLNNVDALVELLVHGGDMDKRDNQGFSAAAYASLLPPGELAARNMELSVVGKAIKLFAASDVFICLKRHGLAGLADRVAENREAYLKSIQKTPEIKLLEENGLTDIHDPNYDYRKELKVLGDRLNPNIASVLPNPEEVVTKPTDSPPVYRCHICTLIIPCSHFATPAMFLKRFSTDELGLTALETPKGQLSPFQKELRATTRVYVKPPEVILMEAELADRKSDRNKVMVDEFRERIKKIATSKIQLIEHIDDQTVSSDRFDTVEDGVGEDKVVAASFRLPFIDDKYRSEGVIGSDSISDLPFEMVFPFAVEEKRIEPMKSALRSNAFKRTKRNVRFKLPAIEDAKPTEPNSDSFLEKHLESYRAMQAAFEGRLTTIQGGEGKVSPVKGEV